MIHQNDTVTDHGPETDTMSGLEPLFTPSCVAVVGASDSEGSVGRALMENLTDDFEGEVVPINPDHDAILGHECYSTLGAVSGSDSIDVAVVATPPEAVIDVVQEAGEEGIEEIVIITSGFAEAESDGATRQEQLQELAEEYDLDVVGPNCLGVISTRTGLNATFAPESASPGPISFMSQSGALISAVLDWAADGIGFKDIVSLGNGAVLTSVDFLDDWSDDPETNVVLAYLEDIERGREFIDVGRDVTQDTPLVVLQSGQSQAGTEAASSHTGALSGSAAISRAGLDQAGAIRAEDVETMLDVTRVLVDQPVPESDGIGIVTNAGGPGVLATDIIDESRLSLSSFTDDTRSTLGDSLPDEADIENPLDVLGSADAEQFREVLDTVLDDSTVGAVIVIACPTGVLDFDALATAVADRYDDHDKPLVTCLMGSRSIDSASQSLTENGIPNYFDPARAIQSLDALARFSEIRQHEYHPPTTFAVDEERARSVLMEATQRDSDHLDVDAMELLDAYGISVPDGGVAENPNEAVELAREIDGPVVMKVVSPDIVHKSDVGGVIVGVEVDDVANVFGDILTRAQEHRSDATILGVLVQEMVDSEAGQETIIGMDRDPQFGPALMFGFGGLYMQVFEDTTFRVAPVSEQEARCMTEEIETASLLRGARDNDAVDIDALVETIQRVSQLVTDFSAIEELDINPLVALPDGVYAVDLGVTVDDDKL